MADSIPDWISPIGFVIMAIPAIIVIPILYPPGGAP
jgi:hypothetical protein